MYGGAVGDKPVVVYAEINFDHTSSCCNAKWVCLSVRACVRACESVEMYVWRCSRLYAH